MSEMSVTRQTDHLDRRRSNLTNNTKGMSDKIHVAHPKSLTMTDSSIFTNIYPVTAIIIQ